MSEAVYQDLSQRIEEILMELLSVKSDTGTILEKDVEDHIYNWIGQLEYFDEHPEYYGSYKLEKDPLERSVVWGLIKGESDNTVILMHHHDVVDAFDYGPIADYAYSPYELQNALSSMDISKEVRDDLESDEWLFGRGTADMKGGAAVQMALLEKYSNLEECKGNILLISVPDEESLSAGMRECTKLLQDLKNRFNLQFSLLINSEPHQRDAERGVIFEGSVGKTLSLVYVTGKKTHIGDIFQGFNPVTLLSEIVRDTELNVDLSDCVEGEVSPPPSWSYLRDRKERYDASIPSTAAGYFSILTLKKTPKDILHQLKSISENSFTQVIKNMNKNYHKYLEKEGGDIKDLPWTVNVSTFREIYEEAVKKSGDEFIEDYEELVRSLGEDVKNNKIDVCQSTFNIIEKTLEYTENLEPRIVIAFAPPYYPHLANIDYEKLPEKILTVTNELINYANEEWNETYIKKHYFMGISDMSYFGLNDSDEIIPYIGPNMPLWKKTYDIPFEEMKSLSIPVINIGPWGKDLHKFTERVYKRDLKERTMELIECAIEHVL